MTRRGSGQRGQRFAKQVALIVVRYCDVKIYYLVTVRANREAFRIDGASRLYARC